MKFFPKLLLALVALVLGAYLAAAGYLYATQDQHVLPQSIAADLPPTTALPAAAQQLSLKTPRGDILRGVLVGPAHPQKLLLAFAGNARDAAAYAVFLKQQIFPNDDLAVASFNYRGYPSGLIPASTGHPSQRKLYSDALQQYDLLTQQLHPQQTYLVGYSLGTSVATFLATRRPVAGLVLVAPFTSIRSLAQRQYPWLPVRVLLKNPFPTETFIARVTAPVTIFYSHTDGLIPDGQAQQLADLALHHDHLREITAIPNATHGDILYGPTFPALLRAAILSDNEVAAPSPPAKPML